MLGIIASSITSALTGNILYVGGRSDSVSSSTISLTGLTGGLASQPSTGDLVMVVYGRGVNNGTTSNLSVTGYTQVANLAGKSASGDDLYFYVGYKYLSAADTTLSLVNSTTTESAVAIHVWRNVNSTTPIDVTSTTFASAAGSTDNARPIPPSITPVTSGAIVLSAVGIGSDTAGRTWTNSGLDNVVSAPDDITTGQECHIAIGSDIWSSGTYNVPTWTSDDTDPSYSSAAVTMALRPA